MGAAAYLINLMEHESKDANPQTKLWFFPGLGIEVHH